MTQPDRSYLVCATPRSGSTLVCDRARITQVRNDAIDMKFLMAGTDFVPRLRLLRERVLRATPDEVTKIVQRVVKRAVACC